MTATERPVVTRTPRGPVEHVTTGEGPALLALHGAMGGWDQASILARAIAPPGHRAIAPSRPGYLGTPLEIAAGLATAGLLAAGMLPLWRRAVASRCTNVR